MAGSVESKNNGNSKEFVRNFGNIGSDGVVSKCPGCGSKNIVNDSKRAEIYCGDCGIVIVEDMIDSGPDWRSYDAEQSRRRARTGPLMTFRIHDGGMSVPICDLTRIKEIRFPKIQSMHISPTENSLSCALGETERIASNLGLPKHIRERTGKLYRKAMKEKIIRGHNADEIISALLCYACKEAGISRSFAEIAKASGIDKKKIERAYSFLIRKKEKIGLKLVISRPEEYVPRFRSELGLSEEVQSKAIEIAKEIFEAGLDKKSKPTTIAAVAIYIAADLFGQHRTEKEIAEACDVVSQTLRDNRNKIEKALNIEIPEEYPPARELIDEIYSHLDFYRETIEKERIKRRAVEIMNEAEKIKRENGKREKYRKALAAAAIATAAKEKYGSNFPITKKIAEAVEIDILRIRYREKQIKKRK